MAPPSNSANLENLKLFVLDKLSMLGTTSIMTQSNSLGTLLFSARKSKDLSLRDVEAATGVSNAYVSQLETGKIKEPSPVTLHKLSELYKVPYSQLLSAAGYPLPGKSQRSNDSGLAARLGPVTKDEEAALVEYLDFLRSRRKRG